MLNSNFYTVFSDSNFYFSLSFSEFIYNISFSDSNFYFSLSEFIYNISFSDSNFYTVISDSNFYTVFSDYKLLIKIYYCDDKDSILYFIIYEIYFLSYFDICSLIDIYENISYNWIILLLWFNF